MRLLVCITLLSLFLLCQCEKTSDTYYFRTAAVAADNTECSKVGSDILEAGGNAVDASIATTICLGTLQGFASGIGGGGVAVIYDAEKDKVQVYDFREIAPGSASKDMYKDTPEDSSLGGRAIAIPGLIAGLRKLWEDHGSYSWKGIVEPSVKLSQSSIVGELLADEIQSQKEYILEFQGLRDIFAPGGKLLVQGDTLIQTALAETLIAIQNDPESFYKGELAANMVSDINDAGGNFTMEDFHYYWDNGVHIYEPVSVYYQGLKVVGAPPPYTGGLCMGMALNLIEPFNFPMMTNESSLAQHYLVEAWKWAYADRMAIGDPDYVEQEHVIEAMLSKDHAAVLRQKFNPRTTFPPKFYADLLDPIEMQIINGGTSHMSAVDAKGNVVAMTSTVNLSFGSKILSPLTGVIFNNEMDDFSSPNQTNYFGQPPSKANYIEAYKKPISAMTPTIVFSNGKPLLAIGASGGTKIITATMQALLGVVAWDESIGQAIGNPRCHNQNTGDTTVESAYPDEFSSFLKSTNHRVVQTSGTLASVQGIYINPKGGLEAASDWRKKGTPAGY